MTFQPTPASRVTYARIVTRHLIEDANRIELDKTSSATLFRHFLYTQSLNTSGYYWSRVFENATTLACRSARSGSVVESSINITIVEHIDDWWAMTQDDLREVADKYLVTALTLICEDLDDDVHTDNIVEALVNLAAVCAVGYALDALDTE